MLSLNRADILADGTCARTPETLPIPGVVRTPCAPRSGRPDRDRLNCGPRRIHPMPSRHDAADGGRQVGRTAGSGGEERRRMFSATLDRAVDAVTATGRAESHSGIAHDRSDRRLPRRRIPGARPGKRAHSRLLGGCSSRAWTVPSSLLRSASASYDHPRSTVGPGSVRSERRGLATYRAVVVRWGRDLGSGQQEPFQSGSLT